MQETSTNRITVEDNLDPARATALQAALGEVPTLTEGKALPPFYHQLYFWDAQPPMALARDGHPKIGGLIPDFGLPRRMWAGGRLEFHAPLIAGQSAQKTTLLESCAQKAGRSGPLAFVTLRHDIHQDGILCVTEYQELVYREDPVPGVEPPKILHARTDEEICERIQFDSTLLFRYSALTFNGHRIHYDIDYARKAEGYAGLVVHGPLLAHLLMRLAARELESLKRFSFRAATPLFHFEVADLCWAAGFAWVRGPDGRLIMSAEAV